MALPFEVSLPVRGRLWLMPCPTPEDLDAAAAAGVTRVVSMLTLSEAEGLGMADEQVLCAARGMDFQNAPIKDFGVPDMQTFEELILGLKQKIAARAAIAVHCRAGIGRSGMVSACLLVACGVAPEDAIAQVSKARGVAIPDTVEQAEFIKRFAGHIKTDSLAKP